MKFSEEQVKEIVALKESLIEQIDKHQEGIEMLEKNITVLDLFLKDSSFTKASELGKIKNVETKQEIVEKPVENLTFTELRDRLPPEITDDVVQMLSSSEEALQDFAYIRTQDDVNQFNVKYGVNLVIPPTQA